MPHERLVHIIDDDEQVRTSVSFMLRSEGLATTTHASAETFLAALTDLKPGCLLIDLRMAGMGGLELQKHLHQIDYRMPVIMMTGHGDVTSAVAAMKQGAVDFIQKPFAKSDLIAALEAAWQLVEHPAPTAEARVNAANRIALLTARELEVLHGLVKGYPNKTIAYDLGISPRTVEVHRANAMKKLDVSSLPEMLHLAFLAGIMDNSEVD